MLLSDFFTVLSTGELGGVVLGNRNGTGIAVEDYSTVVSHINLGLTALHTRLLLREEEVFVKEYDNIQLYYLLPQYAISNTASTEPYKYIVDSVFQPFQGNVLKIEQVFNEIGLDLPINDPNNRMSVHTPQYNCLQIPFAYATNAVSVIYRANHPRIVVGAGFDPAQVTLEIPDQVVEALACYVGARAFIGNAADNGKNDVNLHLTRFEQLVQQLEQADLLNSNGGTNLKLRDNGWV